MMTDHGEAGGTRELSRAITPRVSSGTKGGKSQGGAKGSSRSDEPGDSRIVAKMFYLKNPLLCGVIETSRRKSVTKLKSNAMSH